MGFSSDEGCGAAGYGDKIRNSVRQVLVVDVVRRVMHIVKVEAFCFGLRFASKINLSLSVVDESDSLWVLQFISGKYHACSYFALFQLCNG